MPQSIILESGETAFSDLLIKADGIAEPKSYTFALRSFISYPKVDLFSIRGYLLPEFQDEDRIDLNTAGGETVKFLLPPSYLTINIRQFSFQDWWTIYGGVISAILSVLATIIGSGVVIMTNNLFRD